MPPLFDLLHLILPNLCLACSGRAEGGPSRLGLCPECAERLRPAAPGCSTCGQALPATHFPDGYRCSDCRSDPPAFERLLAGWSYEPPFDAVIGGLKFRRLEYLGPALAEALAARLGADLAGCSLVVPVPLHWRRQILRGYNQAETIARPLARHLGLPFGARLLRRRFAPPQMGLGREERLRNPQGKLRCPDPGAVRGQAILLVDDVATTAATLREAARCLEQGGAKRVLALAAGLTPRRPD